MDTIYINYYLLKESAMDPMHINNYLLKESVMDSMLFIILH